jgi:hypothetical protein
MARTTKADLTHENARLRAENGAMAEWLWSIDREACDTLTVEAPDVTGDTRFVVEVRALFRASGGVARLHAVSADGSTEYSDLPQYLDTLIERWTSGHSVYLRDAASKLRRLQTEAIRARMAG